MARAYRYAEGRGPKPPELDAGELLDRFGVMTVYGRPLTAGEMREIMTAEAIVRYYRARAEADNEAEWANDHPGAAALLARSWRAANE